MNWTEAQRQTIEIRDKNILVSAAAGSGKTAVLIERIKRLIIDEKTDVDRFLITTFTNAASAEMKERLEKAIHEELEKPGTDKAFLKRQLSLIPRANISTFHTFALEVMRKYFYVTDLEPGFKISDETEVSLMKREAVDQLFEYRFHEDYEAFKMFLKKYSSDRNENRLKDNIISLYDEMRSIPDYFKWAEDRAARLDSEEPSVELGLTAVIANACMVALQSAATYYGKAAELLEAEGLEKLWKKAQQDAESIQMACEMLLENGRSGDARKGLERFRDFYSSLKLNQMRAAKEEKEDYDRIKDEVALYRKKGKKQLDDLAKKYFRRTLKEYDEELRESYCDTMYLVGLIKELEDIFREKKQEKNMVDFDDVMHYAAVILQDEMASSEYREKFRYIFIDEYQDSNMLQEKIIDRIARENNLFMVGDVKQSIYKFRLAEPELFKRKYAQYAEGEAQSIKIDLNSNFRSKINVTGPVNRVFRITMDDYDENAMLQCTIDENHPGLPVQLHIINAEDAEDAFMENTRLEAMLVAQLIRENLGQEIYDIKKGCMRAVEYKDIAVLSRNRSMIGELERTLNNDGIPAYGENTGGYFETVEIQVFVNILKVIDNAKQDIPLISVMRCPIFDFHVKELAAIRIFAGEGAFYEAVKAYEQEGPDDVLKDKISDLMEQIAYWKELRHTVSLEELVRILLYETGYFDYCSGLPVGKQRVYNLRLLVEKAGRFEENNYSGLYGFLSYIEAMKKSKLTVGEAKTLGENENVVRVMTVHKSKGLEFPVVILAGAGRTIKFKGVGGPGALHKDLAIGLPHVDVQEKWRRKTLLQRVIEGMKAKEEMEEEIRILYVAMTRAMDRLLITGHTKDPEKLEEEENGGNSYLKMMYGVMRDAGEEIFFHDAETDARFAREERTLARSRIAALMERSRSIKDEEKMREIDKRLSFVYPYPNLGKVKTKYSVTELNKQKEKEKQEVPLNSPGFSREKRFLSASEIGTAMHLVMEKADFSQALEGGVQYICSRADELCEDGFLTEEERRAINVENVAAFFRASVGKRAAQAVTLEKEREFILQKDVDGVPSIVQGIIDCYFEEEDGIVLIDYKNSYMGGDVSEEEIKERYKEQMALYKEALEAAEGKLVKEAYLYLFELQKFVKVS